MLFRSFILKMTDLSLSSLKLQGKRAVCIYNYKATMNDELNLKIDDLLVITQCSEDETWLEGTLEGVTGWFPSNYVHLLEENEEQINDTEQEHYNTKSINQLEENTRIKYLNELKRAEEGFLDEMSKFMKMVIQPLQSNTEILPSSISHQLHSSLDDLIKLHQSLNKQLKEIPDNSDAKIGHLLMKIAPHFKTIYESYAKNNPKYTNLINMKNDQLSKYFESSLTKLNSPLLMQTSSPINVSIYVTKFLAAPFRHIELYVKILKEIVRYSEDYHIDRGDVQRCVEFYSDLSTNIQEIRKKKEFELDIMTSHIKNVDEESLKNSEVLFLSSVLIINEHGDKKDRILLLLSNCIVVLVQHLATNEYEFEFKIPFLNQNNTLLQIRKVSSIDSILNVYGANLINSLVNKYCFELIGLTLQTSYGNLNSSTSVNRLLISCSTQYDLKAWLDLVQHSLNSKKLASSVSSASKNSASNIQKLNNSVLSKQDSNLSLNKPLNTSNGKLNNSSISNANVTLNNNNTNNASFSAATQRMPKTCAFRPHPPLIPHFQLPNDLPQNTSLDGSSTLKRFMYKKPKLTEPFGKYHGADDDLKLLNVIEAFCKAKPRQSINVHVQDVISSAVNKSSILPQQVHNRVAAEINHEANNIQNFVGSTQGVEPVVSMNKHLDKHMHKIIDEKCRIEANLQSVSLELREFKHTNKELKMIISSLQKQLESERNSRKKLENYIRKQLKANNLQHDLSSSANNNTNGIVNIEHESSI